MLQYKEEIDVKTGHVQEWKDKHAALAQDMERLSQEHADKISHAHAEQERHWKQEIASLQQRLDEDRQQWQRQNTSLQQQSDQSKKDMDSMTADLEQARCALEASQSSYTTLQAEMQTLVKENERLGQEQRVQQERREQEVTGHVSRLEKSLAEKDVLLAHMRDQHASTLQDYKDKLAARQGNVQALEQALETAQQEAYLAKEELTDAQHRLARESKAWGRRESSLSLEVEREKEARRRLESEFMLIQQQGGDQEQQQRDLLETLRHEKDRHAKALEKAKQEVTQLAQTVRDLRVENQRLEEENTKTNVHLNDLANTVEVGPR